MTHSQTHASIAFAGSDRRTAVLAVGLVMLGLAGVVLPVLPGTPLIFAGLWLGASCYDQLERARQAVAAGAGYVAFGAFFPSGTKPGARRASPGLLRDSAALGCTRVAIGGITPDNAAGLVAAGADLLAVIGGVFDAPDPVAALRAFRRAFEPNTHETAHQ